MFQVFDGQPLEQDSDNAYFISPIKFEYCKINSEQIDNDYYLFDIYFSGERFFFNCQ